MFAIDCHDHVYNPRLASIVVKRVGEYYNVDMTCGGLAEELTEMAENSPVKKFIINSVAQTAKSVKKLNDFISQAQQQHSELYSLGTLHPDMTNIHEEVDRIISLGLHGIKLHPDSQEFVIDCPAAMRLYECIEGRLPLLIHCGDYRSDLSHPKRLANVLNSFPKLTVVAAHFGGWSIFEDAVPYMSEYNCYMDISSSMPFIGKEKVFEYIRHYGSERLLFGSDFPMWNPVSEYNSFMELPLSDEERKNILYKNSAEIFNIDISDWE